MNETTNHPPCSPLSLSCTWSVKVALCKRKKRTAFFFVSFIHPFAPEFGCKVSVMDIPFFMLR